MIIGITFKQILAIYGGGIVTGIGILGTALLIGLLNEEKENKNDYTEL